MSAAAVVADAGAVPLLGGEVLGESDVDGSGRYGDWLLALLPDVLPTTGRTLVLGRYDDSLLTALAARGTQVDLVLRSLPDATAARIRLAAAGVRVRCGALERIPADGGYDAVLAVDDPAVLSGPDGPPRPWSATLAAIAALARPGAPVVVLVPNPFGLDRLVSVDPPTPAETGGTEAIEAAPSDVDAVPAALAAAGLAVRTLLAGYPGLLATAAALRPTGDVEVPARLVAAAYAAAHPGAAVTDPGRLAYRVVRHGLGFALAPGWLAVTTRCAEPAVGPPAAGTAGPTADDPDGTALLVLADRERPAYWAVPRLVRRTGAGWRAEPLRPDGPVRLLDQLRRDPSRLTGAVPAGPSVADALAGACRRGDLVAVRRLVAGYLTFLGADAAVGGWSAVWSDDRTGEAALCPPDRVLATCDAVLLTAAPATDGPAAHSLAEQSPSAQSPAEQSSVELSPAARSLAERRPSAQSSAEQGPGAQSAVALSPAAQSLAERGPGAQSPAPQSRTERSLAEQGPAEQGATGSKAVGPAPSPAEQGPAGSGALGSAPSPAGGGTGAHEAAAGVTARGGADPAGTGIDGVTTEAGALRLADPSWSVSVPVPVRLVFLRGLQRFAYRLLASGAPHPWPAGVSADRLATTLAATADVTVSPAELVDAAALAVYLTAPLAADDPAVSRTGYAGAGPAVGEPVAAAAVPERGPAAGNPGPDAGRADAAAGVPAVAGGEALGEHAEAVRYAAGQPRWAADPALAAVPPRGYAEALAAIGALSAELADARAQIGWLDATVAERDRRLSELGTLRRSVTYRVGYLATLPYHLGIRLLRRELRRLRRP